MSVKPSIRELHDMADLVKTIDLQRKVWRMGADECTSPHTMKAAVHTGGCVLGAEVDGQMIGFCFGMVGKRQGEIQLWSHMTAVLPAFQGRGIGYLLKQAQRDWALANGYRVMAWTFDPMQVGNANFNFNRLGVVATYYAVNHYGEMRDGLNAGLASDRLEAHWALDSSKVIKMAQPGYQPSPADHPDRMTMVVVEKRGELLYRPPSLCERAHFGVEIPADIAALKRNDIERARQWQLYVRAAMTELLAADYVVTGLIRRGDKVWYVLRRDSKNTGLPSAADHG